MEESKLQTSKVGWQVVIVGKASDSTKRCSSSSVVETSAALCLYLLLQHGYFVKGFRYVCFTNTSLFLSRWNFLFPAAAVARKSWLKLQKIGGGKDHSHDTNFLKRPTYPVGPKAACTCRSSAFPGTSRVWAWDPRETAPSSTWACELRSNRAREAFPGPETRRRGKSDRKTRKKWASIGFVSPG